MGRSSLSVFCEGDRREAELCLGTLISMVVMVVVVSSTLSLFMKVRKFDFGFDRAARFLGVALVELIGKRSKFGLETTSNR